MWGLLLLPFALVWWVIMFIIEVALMLISVVLWPFVWLLGATVKQNEDWHEDETNIT